MTTAKVEPEIIIPASTVPPTAKTPDAVLSQIEQALVALGDQGDQPNTANAQAAWAAATSGLTNRRMTIRSAVAELAKLTPKLTADEKWLNDLEGVHHDLQDDFSRLPPKIRTEEQLAWMQSLEAAVRIVEHGRRVDGQWTRAVETLPPLRDKLLALGYTQAPPEPLTNQAHGEIEWRGGLNEVRARLRELRQQRDAAQARLDAAMRDQVTS
jgi:hypothetical protein